MSRNQRLIIVAVVIGIILITVAYPLWSPFFINNIVDDAFPTLSSAQRDQLRQMPQEQQDVLMEMAEDNAEMASQTAMAMLEDETEMEDEMPTGEPVALSTGMFGAFDAVHRGSGSATIYQLSDGSRILRLESFSVTNGPDLHVLLTSNVPGSILESVNDDYIDLGQLRGNIGNQNYAIPGDIDLQNYSAAVIYCMPFRVNFTVAELE